MVHGHQRKCHSGTKTWVDTHNARNRRQNVTVHLIENIHYLYWNADITAFGPLRSIKGFPAHREVDGPIQFWLQYWKSCESKYPAAFDPSIVKTMIAVESSFKADARSRSSTATGLLQVTNSARRDLSGAKSRRGYRLVRNQIVSVEQTDLFDPLVNIAAATRWLAVKVTTMPAGNLKNTFNLLKAYYDWSDKGAAYAEKVLRPYDQSQ